MDNNIELIDAQTGALILPNGNTEIAEALCAYVHARTMEITTAISAIVVSDETMGTSSAKKDTKAKFSELSKVVESLRDAGKSLMERSAAATDAKRVISQIDNRLWSYSTKVEPTSAYGILSAALKAKKEEIAAWEDAHTPPAPTHTYCIQVQCTDKGLKDLVKALEKVAPGAYRYDAPQSDRQFEALDKWFEANV